MLKSISFTLGLFFLYSCKDPSVVLPTVTTSDIANVGGYTVNGGGEVTSVGDSDLTAIGLVASESPEPALVTGIFSIVPDLNIGSFVSQISGLRSNTTYYLRAYATNKAGTGYGEERTFTTEQVIPQSLRFSELTEIKGYNFTQAIGFQGSKSLQSIYMANRQEENPPDFQVERLYRYDLLDGSTTVLFNPIIDFISKEIQIVNGQLLVMGSQYVSTYEFDLSKPPMAVANGKKFTRHGSAQLDGEIYVYGGDLNGIDSDKIQRWNVASSAFEYLATMPGPKSYAGGEIVDGKLYVFGGQQQFQGTLQEDIIYVYNFAEDSFATLNLPQALYRSYTAQVGSLIYVAGHINPTGNDNTDIFFGVFNTQDNNFREIGIDLTDAGSASIWALTAVGNDLYVVYGDPNNVDELSQEQTFTIQRAEIP
jgi:Kelch motif protein